MKKPSRILIFSTSYLPYVGGAEIAIKEITDRIHDIEFDLITGRFDRKLKSVEKIGNATIYRIGIGITIVDKLLLPFWGALKTLQLNSLKHYQNYWCVMATFASGAAYIANILHFWRKVPIILTLQEGDSEEHFKNRWGGLINISWKLALRYATEVTAISSYLAERAKKFGYKKEVKIVPNGVDLKIFIKKFNLQRLHGELEFIRLWTFSRLTEKNGIKDIIKAIKLLNGEFGFYNKAKLFIAGTGHLGPELIKLSEKLKIEKQIEFLKQKSQKDIVNMLRESENSIDIFVRPSLSEGFGNAFIEAMAVGIPVIATNIGGIPDFLKDPSNTSGQVATGLFCKVNNPESIAEKVMEYINNPELTNKIITNARKMVEEKYDWQKITSQMEEIFDNVVKTNE